MTQPDSPIQPQAPPQAPPEKKRRKRVTRDFKGAKPTKQPNLAHGKVKAKLAQVIADPVLFVKLCWPEMKLYPRQVEILRSIVDNAQTYVHAANEMGKTRVAALAAIWWFASRSPSRVVTTSSSETQLRNILWSEIRHLIETSRVKLPFDVKDLIIRKVNQTDSEEQFIPLNYLIGYVSRTVESFQGHHLHQDKPRVLVIFEEASGIGDVFKDAADSWAHRVLVIGNPLNTSNFFYRGCKGGDVKDPSGECKLLRKVIHIDGLDSPNVKLGMALAARGHKGHYPLLIPGLLSYPEYLRREHDWDEVKKRTRLRGLFYEGEQTLLYPMDWLDRSEIAFRRLIETNAKRIPKAIGLDVAMGGRDLTVWSLIDEFGLVKLIPLDTPNTMEIPGRTINLMREFGIPPRCVAIDMGGGGKQISDRMAELGYQIMGVSFGSSAGSDCEDAQQKADAHMAFANKRAEMYGYLRKTLNPAITLDPFALPPEEYDLRQELAVLPLMYDSEGKLILPPKDRATNSRSGVQCIRDMLGRSPDRADALVLGLWAFRFGCSSNYWTVSTKEAVEQIAAKAETMEESIQSRVAAMMARLQ